MHQNIYSSVGAVVYGVENESEKQMWICQNSLDNNLGSRNVSFKQTGQEGIINEIRMNFQREK